MHFSYKSDVPNVPTKVKEKMKESLKLMPLSKYVDAIRSSTKCEYKIYERSALFSIRETAHSERIRNEAELRYVLGDPIMEMMCKSGELKVC